MDIKLPHQLTVEQAKHIVNVILNSNPISRDIKALCYANGVEGERHSDIIKNPTIEQRMALTDMGKKVVAMAHATYSPLDDAKVGDGITYGVYTDKEAYTVISRSNKSIVAQMDNAELLNKDELEFIPGGFSAHCTNQFVQKYAYTANPDGAIVTFTRRKNGKYIPKGSTMSHRGATVGRHKFYDYNF